MVLKTVKIATHLSTIRIYKQNENKIFEVVS